MASLMLLILQYIITEMSKSSPFLVSTPKWHGDATTYCNDYCGGGFLSVHSMEENERAIEIINNSLDTLSIFIEDTTPYNNHNENPVYINDVWHGLYRINNSNLTNFTWSDGSAFNFGTTGKVYPWVSGEPNNVASGEGCVHFWMAKNKNWNDFVCDNNLRFICNNCNGKLNKYIVIHYDRNYNEAQLFCNQYLGTTLASLHSNEDYQAALALLSVNNDKDYWIGLNDIGNEGNFNTWNDGSYLDWAYIFGTNPWGEGEPNGGLGENCIELQGVQSYRMNDKTCSEPHPFICNLPSELCIENNWDTYGDMHWNNCDVNSMNNSVSIINNKQWIYSDSIWVIDYLFTIRNVSGIYGESGIVLYHFDSVCDYYFIGIAISNNTAHIFVYKYFNYQKIINYYSPVGLFTYIYDTYYTLQVKLTYSTHIQFDISINNNHSVTYNDTSSNLYVNHTKFIGLRNINANIVSKSLYASDTPKYTFSDDLSFTQCTPTPTTINPTNHPTVEPTFNPTSNPTIQPSFLPTNNPTIYPTTQPVATAPPSNLPTTVHPTFNPTSNPVTMHPTNIPTTNPTTNEPTYPMTTDEVNGYIITIEAEDVTKLDVDIIKTLVNNQPNDIDVSDVFIDKDSNRIIFTVSSDTQLDTDIIQNDIENTLENKYDQDFTVTIKSTEKNDDTSVKSNGFFDNLSYLILIGLVIVLMIVICVLLGCLCHRIRRQTQAKGFKKSVSNIQLSNVNDTNMNKLENDKVDVLTTPLKMSSQPQLPHNIGTLSSGFGNTINTMNTMNTMNTNITITPFTVTSFIPNHSVATMDASLPVLDFNQDEKVEEEEEEMYQPGPVTRKDSTDL